MKKLALLALVALETCVCGCGNNAPTNSIATQSITSYWEAQLAGGGQDNLLDFMTQFSTGEYGTNLTSNYFAFFNQNACFPSGLVKSSGTATLTTNSSDQVTGTLSLSVTPPAGSSVDSTLTLNGNVYGNSSGGSTSTVGNLSNGVVSGTWTLTSSDTSCVPSGQKPSGTFLMCQGAATCSVP